MESLKGEFKQQLKEVTRQTEMAVKEKERANEDLREIKGMLMNHLLGAKRQADALDVELMGNKLSFKKQTPNQYAQTNQTRIQGTKTDGYNNYRQPEDRIPVARFETDDPYQAKPRPPTVNPNMESHNTIQLQANTNFIPIDKRGDESNKVMLTYSMMRSKGPELKQSHFGQKQQYNPRHYMNSSDAEPQDDMYPNAYQFKPISKNNGILDSRQGQGVSDSIQVDDVMRYYSDLDASNLINMSSIDEKVRGLESFLANYGINN